MEDTKTNFLWYFSSKLCKTSFSVFEICVFEFVQADNLRLRTTDFNEFRCKCTKCNDKRSSMIVIKLNLLHIFVLKTD